MLPMWGCGRPGEAVKKCPENKKTSREALADLVFNACKDDFNDPYHIDPYRLSLKIAKSIRVHLGLEDKKEVKP